MSLQKPDRRVKRTRRLIHDALHQLMREKRYDDITVQDIIDRADVGRSTFYAHYEGKEDLATSGLIQIMDGLNAAMVESDPQGGQVLPTRILFEHIEENRHVFKTMVRDRGLEFFFEKGKQFWAERMQEHLHALLPAGREPVVPIPLIAESAAGTFITLMKWWLDSREPCPAAEMAQMADRLILPGVWSALGLPESDDQADGTGRTTTHE